MPRYVSSRRPADTRTAPFRYGQAGDQDDGELTGDESHQPPECRIHESVAVQADAEHVYPEPAPGRDHVAEDGQTREPASLDQARPPDMQQHGVPNHNQQRAVFLRIPAPEPAPGLIRPDSAQDCSNETEQSRETNHTVDHAI